MSKEAREIQKEIIERFKFRPVGVEDGHIIVYACNSMSTQGVEYEIRHCLATGSVECSCPDFQIRHRRDCPCWEHGHVCKHIRFLQRLMAGGQHEK